MLGRQAFRTIAADRRGIAAVEFALIAPFAILLYCGFAELTMAMMAERRAAHAASVVADLVSQTAQVSATTDLPDIYKVGGAIMSPFSSTPLLLRVTSVTADAKGVPKMTWSQGSGLAPLPAGTVSGFPPTLLAAGDSVIQADVQYAYTSPLQMILPKPITFKSTFYLKPRRSPSVTLTP
jgi:Flp pilus assembly protein TadG